MKLVFGGRTAHFAAFAVVLAAVGAASFFLLDAASVRFVAANSDGATVVLEGQSMAHGSVLLAGWSLPLDSFFSTEVPFYALAVRLFGLRADLVNAVPAVLAASVVVVGVVIASRAGRGIGRLAGALVVVALLAFPSPAFAFFFVQGPWHVGTALACLIAFCGAAAPRWGWRAGIAVVALAAGLLGDVQTLALGVAPIVVVAGVVAFRSRSPRAAFMPLSVAIAGVVAAVALRRIFDAIGTFALVNANPTARLAQVGINLRHLPARFAGLLGVGSVPIGPDTTASRLGAVHVIGLIVVVAGVAIGAYALIRSVVLGQAHDISGRGSRTVDDLLVLGFFGDLGAFVVLAATGNGASARYLTAGVIFAVVLVGRQVSRVASDHPSPVRWMTVGAAAVLTVALAGGYVTDLGHREVVRPVDALGAFLESHDLTSGVGDYWSASIVTASTGGKVTVRPVITTPSGKLARYGRQSTAAWYRGTRFSFLVYDLHRPWRSVGAASAAATFGPPRAVLAEGTYRIYLFRLPEAVSPVGYSNP